MNLIEWESRFKENLRLGFADTDLKGTLDEILAWHSSHEQGSETHLGTELLEDYSREELRRRIENFLDRLLFVGPEAANTLFRGLQSQQQEQLRYRRLVRVFHPDKGVNPTEWLNVRTDIINKAYAKHKNFKRPPQVMSKAASSRSKKFKQKDTRNVPWMRDGLRNWRRVFGNPREFQSRVTVTLSWVLFACLAAILVLLLKSR